MIVTVILEQKERKPATAILIYLFGFGTANIN